MRHHKSDLHSTRTIAAAVRVCQQTIHQWLGEALLSLTEMGHS